MIFDANVPPQLLKAQQWFGHLITEPLEGMETAKKLTPDNRPIEDEAKEWILPSPTLLPHQRLEIYNQQYWWRLVDLLQNAYPFLLCLFGPGTFNEQLAVPFLLQYPPRRWGLSDFGKEMTEWIDATYHDIDRDHVLFAAKMDLAWETALYIPRFPSPAPLSPEEFLNKPLRLQSHCTLFECPADYWSWRQAFLNEDAEYWLEHDFPTLQKEGPYCCVIYRDIQRGRICEPLSLAKLRFFQILGQGQSVEQLCAYLEKSDCKQTSEHELAMIENLTTWLEEGLAKDWLTTNA